MIFFTFRSFFFFFVAVLAMDPGEPRGQGNATRRRPLIALGAGLGPLVSIYNAFSPVGLLAPTSNVSGTPALLAIAATAILLVAGLVLAGTAPGRGLAAFFIIGSLVGILGTGFVAWLLHSKLLVALMLLLLRLAAPGLHPPPGAPLMPPALALTLGSPPPPPPPRTAPGQLQRRPRRAEVLAADRDHPGKCRQAGPGLDPAHRRRLRRRAPPDPDARAAAAEGPPPTVWSATPLVVNDTLYLGTPFYRIFAVEPDTGRVKWTYDSHSELEALTQPDLKNRGVAYWAAADPAAGQPCQKRIYLGTMDARLHAVDADTGALCADFGQGGILDFNAFNTSNARWPLSILQPPTVFGDTLFVGWAGKDWAESVDSPGSVYALDARTGAVKWTFDTLPPEVRAKTGTANVWASMSVDTERHLLFIPVSSPSPNFYQAEVPLDLPIVTSVTALDTDTGRMVWTRQLVHHDLWDYDTNAPPTLVDITSDGQSIPALVQTSKQGFLYVLNRATGEPVYPIVERPVPASDVPGELSAATQPFVDLPSGSSPTAGPASPASRTSSAAATAPASPPACATRAPSPRRASRARWSIRRFIGGIEWGGGAVDPRSGIFVTNYSSVAEIYRLIPRADYDDAAKSAAKAAASPR